MYYNVDMTKVITFRVNEEEQKLLEDVINKYNTNKKEKCGASDVIKNIMKIYMNTRDGIDIPSHCFTKDEIAQFLGIGKLEKRWVTFMDKIKKTYYE